MGAFPFRYLSKTPAYPESDISGVIVGGKVEGTAFKVGDEVFGQIPYSTM
jgi:NADPH:quinone reductase-like Zn-dependent oxidoreductase